MVEQRGIEPLTSALRTRRSAKLSYCPTSKTRKHAGFEKLLATRMRIPFQVLGFKFQVARRLVGSTEFDGALDYPLPPKGFSGGLLPFDGGR
jgi:hypothetical protein